MTDRLTIALHQSKASVGDIAGNTAAILAARTAAGAVDLLMTPELSLIGYPPEDLVLKPAAVAACAAALGQLAAATGDGGPGLLVGLPWAEDGRLYNAAALLDGGRVVGITRKHDLPNYGTFDEKRVFAGGPLPGPLAFRGVRLGVPVCEDIWTPEVTECLAETGAELLLVPNGSPFEVGKDDRRLSLSVSRVVETGLPLAYLNRVGGAGRAGLRRGELRAQRRPAPRRATAGLGRGAGDDALAARQRRLERARRARSRASTRSRPTSTTRCWSACATM